MGGHKSTREANQTQERLRTLKPYALHIYIYEGKEEIPKAKERDTQNSINKYLASVEAPNS